MKHKARLIFGCVLTAVGIVLIALSVYINRQVEEGRGEIASAQAKVDQGNRLFSAGGKTSKQIGQGITAPIQNKIDDASRQASYYDGMATSFLVIGIVLLLPGVALIGTSFTKR